MECETRLELHPDLAAWTWRIQLRNDSSRPFLFDILQAQDLGLADEGAVRNNEAYTSQYLDLNPQHDDLLGWTILARQNQAQAHGRFPWLAVGCVQKQRLLHRRLQFYGNDHRLTNEPAAARSLSLPSKRLQYEFALAGLQSHLAKLAPGATTEVSFVARFVEDHPAASSAADLSLLREVAGAAQAERRDLLPSMFDRPPARPRSSPLPPGCTATHQLPPIGTNGAFAIGVMRNAAPTDSFFLFLRCDDPCRGATRRQPFHGRMGTFRSGDARWFDVDIWV